MFRRVAMAIAACQLAGAWVLVGMPGQAAVSTPRPVLIVDNLPKVCPTSAFCYSPATVTVKVGTTVKWTNASVGTHTVTGVNGGPSSKAFITGQSYSYTFRQAGSFTYYCTLHGFAVMHGTVDVTG
jgi:plastocyanin